MTITILDSSSKTTFTTTSDLDVSVTLPVGTLVVVQAVSGGQADISSVADSRGNSYTKQTMVDNANPADGFSFNTAYAILTTQLEVGDVITVTMASGDTSAAFLAASGIASVSPLDGQSSDVDNSFPTSTTTDSGDVTTTVADVLLVGTNVCLDPAGTTFTPSTSFTEVEETSSAGSVLRHQMEYRIVSATGTYTTNAVASNSVYWGSRLLAFKGAGGPAPQILAPSADSVDGSWTDQTSGTSLAAAIDEAAASDADYIQSEVDPSTSGCRVKLASGIDPASSSGHIIRWRIRKDSSDGDTTNMTVTLRQGGGNSLGGGTQIATFTRNNVDGSGWTTYSETLSGAEADSITDYSDLYLEFYADTP